VKTFVMLLRREFWEHRSLWITPVMLALVMLLAVTLLGGQVRIDVGGASLGGPPGAPPGGIGPGGGAVAGGRPFAAPGLFGELQLVIGVPFYATAALLIISYLLDCLYAERRDRSILFWKSLPVSDAAVVLSKLFVALILTPLLFYATAAACSLALDAVLVTSSARSSGNLSAALANWTVAEWLRTQGIILYAVYATALWYAPYAAYLMLVSAWARRSVLAWAVLPPLMLALLERLFLSTSYIGDVVSRSFSDVLNLAFRLNSQLQATITDVIRAPRGGGRGGRGGVGGGAVIDPRFDPTDLLSSPQLWIGLALTVLMIWGAISVRKRSHDL
jgi:ABC-2 type transport system permease protein